MRHTSIRLDAIIVSKQFKRHFNAEHFLVYFKSRVLQSQIIQ